MLFNSWEFWCFFAVVYIAYLLVGKRWAQNVLLLVASYFFYASWDWRFLSLILASTTVDYLCGLGLEAATGKAARRALLTVSVVFNLSLLGFFKYFEFFVSSFTDLLNGFGLGAMTSHLEIVLPVGISFYTFQTLSYTIDVYRREVKPTKNIIDFALFVAFFPQLVAGPIERAKRFLPQIYAPRHLEPQALSSGAWLVCWGLWKKVVVADNLGMIVDYTFEHSANATAAGAYLAVIAFCFQIYCDFSGYSDIARGVARLLGFELMRNFDLPFFAKDPSDFWRRWHISLSTWLRDYLYIPLGGSRGSSLNTYRNLMITMVLGGLWHGASWNFVCWGVYHGLLLIGYRAYRESRPYADSLTSARHLLQVGLMFHAVALGFLIFRCTREVYVDGQWVGASYQQFMEMFGAWKNGAGIDRHAGRTLISMARVLWPLLLIQAMQYRTGDHYFLLRWPFAARVLCYAGLLLVFVLFAVGAGESFIYFQF